MEGEVDINQDNYMLLFKYFTKHLLIKDKIRFYYALKGRDGKSGILKTTETMYLGKTVLLAPIKYEDELMRFFADWKLPFTVRKVIITGEESILC